MPPLDPSLDEEILIRSKSSDEKAVELFFNSLPLSSTQHKPTENVSFFNELDDGNFDSSFLCALTQEETTLPSDRQVGKKTLSPARLDFHKDYLIKRIKEMDFQYGSSPALFEEIKVKGYRGSLKQMQAFLTGIRRERRSFSPEVHLDFHKNYLIKRIEETYPLCVPAPILFKEIKAKGYRGSRKTVELFLTTTRKNMRSLRPESDFDFHKSYLIKRIEETHPFYPSAPVLFKEIKGKGYRGSPKKVQMFLAAMRKKRCPFVPEACLDFHRDYLIKRIEEMRHPYGATRVLFEEIKGKGYRGSIKTMRNFVTKIYKKYVSLPENLHFHKEYLTEQIRKNPHLYPKASTLFKAIQYKGYKRSFKNMEMFLATITKQSESITKSLDDYKDYLKKRLKEAQPHRGLSFLLFKDIEAKGYRGSLKSVRNFLAKVGKQKWPQLSPVMKMT